MSTTDNEQKKVIKDVSNVKNKKGAFYDEIEISAMEFDEATQTFTYPCPCGDNFLLTVEQIQQGEDIARCPSCSLIIRVIYEVEYASDEAEEPSQLPPDPIIAY